MVILSDDVGRISETVVIISDDVSRISDTVVIISDDMVGNIVQTDIDTFSELDTIVADEQLVSGDTIIVLSRDIEIISSDIDLISGTVVILSDDAVNWASVIDASESISADVISADILWLLSTKFPEDLPADNDVIKYDSALGRLNFEVDTTGSTYWDRTGTVLTPATAGDTASIDASGDLICSGDTTLATLNINNAYNLPTADGNAGEVISTDGAGTLQWGVMAIKAWAYVDGTGTATILDSHNVASLTDNGAGDYSLSWDTAFATENYAVIGTIEDPGATLASLDLNIEAQVPGGIRVLVGEGTPADHKFSIIAIGR